MLFGVPFPESPSLCGYTAVRAYRGVALPSYAEVAAAFPGTDAGVQLSAELDNVMLDCHKPGWDGYGAEAVSPDAYRLAKRFIQSLPTGIPRPSISADPDGCVTFEWQVSSRRLVLVSVHADYRIDYAAIFGSQKDSDYGTKPFFDKFPTRLSELVRRVYQA